MERNKIILYITIIFLSIIIISTNLTSAEIKNAPTTITVEEIIAKVKEEVIAELKQSAKKVISLKNSIKIKYKLVDDSKDRVYTLMYYRDLTSHHNLGIGYEYTDSKIDKRAFLVEYTYKF